MREKEQIILRDIQDDIDYTAGEITVLALVERYILQRQGVRYNTKVGYNFVLNLLKKEDFAYRQIKDIKPSDAKEWFIKLHDGGYKYSTITTATSVLKPAFEMAVEDDIVRRNPFSFRVVDVIPMTPLPAKPVSYTHLVI